jgi:glutathione S-transferase
LLTGSQAQWVAALKGVTNEYKNEFLPNYYAQIAQYYSQNKGPYLLGDKITYVDFAVYQSIDNDMRIGSIPLLPVRRLTETHNRVLADSILV